MSLRYVDNHGNEVPDGDPRSAYQIRDDDPASERLVERLKSASPVKLKSVVSVPLEDERPVKPKPKKPVAKGRAKK